MTPDVRQFLVGRPGGRGCGWLHIDHDAAASLVFRGQHHSLQHTRMLKQSLSDFFRLDAAAANFALAVLPSREEQPPGLVRPAPVSGGEPQRPLWREKRQQPSRYERFGSGFRSCP
jgi:hypothetical protein